jgi:hypothetical protein
VPRVEAKPVVTFVANKLAVWDLPVKQLVRITVRCKNTILHRAKLPVACFKNSAIPIPALVAAPLFLYVRLESAIITTPLFA